MNRIIVGAEDSFWANTLRLSASLEVLEWDPTLEVTLAELCSNHCFVLLDLKTYTSLCDSLHVFLHRMRLLLILPTVLAATELSNFRHRSLSVFTYEEGRPKDVVQIQNLLTFVDNCFHIQVLTKRLENYISDSFKDIVDTNLLQAQKKEIEVLNKRLEDLSRTDSLTHLLNRRALMEAFEMEKKRALRNRWRMEHSTDGQKMPSDYFSPDHGTLGRGSFSDHVGNFSCLMVDIDHFKRVNDFHGHLSGDDVLKCFGEIIQTGGLFRDSDILGRYGGEEFIILLPETNAINAMIPAQRLREAIKEVVFTDEAGNNFSITISIGVAEFLPEEVEVRELISRADKALYYAKDHGRDQVCIYTSELLK